MKKHHIDHIRGLFCERGFNSLIIIGFLWLSDSLFSPEEWLLVPVPGDLTSMMNCQVQSELGQMIWLIVFKPNEKRKSVFSSITCQGPPHLPVSWDQQCSFPNRQYGFPCHLVHKQKVKENDKWQMD